MKTQDKIHDALSTIIREDDSAMITKWVVVMEVMDEEGTRQLWSLNSPDIAMWDEIGMLQFRRDMLVPEPPSDDRGES